MQISLERTVSFHDMIVWLEANVGKSLWTRPIIEARGNGWHIKLIDVGTYNHVWRIDIDDQQQAVLFWIKWS